MNDESPKDLPNPDPNPSDFPTVSYDSAQPFRPPGSIRPAGLREGATFGQYRLIRLLGRGGFGEVWEAEGIDTKRRLALKVLTGVHAGSPELLERFKREGRMAASVNHPRCVFVLGAEEIEDRPVITMDLMRGGTLQDRIAEEGPLSPRDAVDLTLDLIEGLEAAHQAGLIHRDIKPSNCFLDDTGRAKIGDWGISKTLEVASDLTLSGAFVGTPSFASPEQVRGRDLGLESDIYSLGATLYAVLTGVPPFSGANAGEVLARIVAEEAPPLAEHSVDAPKGLERVIRRAMAKDPAKRFAGYAGFRSALLPFSSRGLTSGSLVRRVVAYYVDSVMFAPLGFLTGFSANLAFVVGGALLPYVYLAVTEKLWGRGLGKLLLGLRVTGADGSPVSGRQAVVRTFVFAIGPLATNALIVLLPSPFISYVGFLTTLIIISTMRSRNGFAGIHELVSGTRVMAVRRRSTLDVPDTVRHLPPSVDGDRQSEYGPYSVTRTIWSDASGALLVARDELLERDLWIHEQRSESARAIEALTAVRSGRLHWLQGNREGPTAWDAYEMPSGTDLISWVRRNGRLSWREVRVVLHGVLVELESLIESDDGSARWSLRHVWMDSRNDTKLLEFPARVGPEDGPTLTVYPVGEWKLFVREIVFFGLTGEIAAPAASPAPQVPMPEHARAFIGKLSEPVTGDESLSQLVHELIETMDQPARVTRRRRVAPILTTLVPGLLPVFGALTAFLMFSLAPPAFLDMILAPQYVREMERQQELSDSIDEAEFRSEPFERVLAYSYQTIQSNPQGRSMFASIPAETVSTLESAAEKYPSVSEEEAAEARSQTQVGLFPFASFQEGSTIIVGALLWVVLGFLVIGGICSLVATLALGTQPLVSLWGMTLQTTDGQKAGRIRTLFRSAAAWSPVLGVCAWQLVSDRFSLLVFARQRWSRPRFAS